MDSMLTLGQIVHIGGGAGGLLFLIGWIWLVIMGFKDGQWWWGLVVLIVPVLGGLIYGGLRWPGTKVPLILLVVGLLLGGGTTINSLI
jgi:hypothetical protein